MKNMPSESNLPNPPLYYISRFFQICPSRYVSSTESPKKRLILLFIFISSMVAIFAWSFMARYMILYKFLLIGYIDLFIHIFMSLVNLWHIVKAQFCRKHWEILFQVWTRRKRHGLVLDNCGNFVLYCFAVSISGMSMLHSIIGPYFYMLLRLSLIYQINFYILLTWVLLLNTFAKAIKENIQQAKAKLSKEVTRLINIKDNSSKSRSLDLLKTKSNLHQVLGSMVNIKKSIVAFNEIYGIQILGLSALIMLFVTDTMNAILVYLYQNIGVHELMIKGYVAIIMMVLGVFVIAPCFSAAKEIDEIRNALCEILVHLPRGTEDGHLVQIRKRISLLSSLLEYWKPYFSAAGFFDADYSMFAYIMSGVISFVVVYLQLRDLI